MRGKVLLNSAQKRLSELPPSKRQRMRRKGVVYAKQKAVLYSKKLSIL